MKILYEEPLEGKEIKQKFNLDKKNKILSFDYKVSNNLPRVFDIIEYNITLGTVISELKLKSISFLFNNQDRNKVKYSI